MHYCVGRFYTSRNITEFSSQTSDTALTTNTTVTLNTLGNTTGIAAAEKERVVSTSSSSAIVHTYASTTAAATAAVIVSACSDTVAIATAEAATPHCCHSTIACTSTTAATAIIESAANATTALTKIEPDYPTLYHTQLNATKLKVPFLKEKLPITVEGYYSLFIHNQAIESYSKYFAMEKNYDIVTGEWVSMSQSESAQQLSPSVTAAAANANATAISGGDTGNDSNSNNNSSSNNNNDKMLTQSRLIQFVKPLFFPGYNKCRCSNSQKILKFSDYGLIIYGSSSMQDLPACDLFTVDNVLAVYCSPEMTIDAPECYIEVSGEVKFLQYTIFR